MKQFYLLFFICTTMVPISSTNISQTLNTVKNSVKAIFPQNYNQTQSCNQTQFINWAGDIIVDKICTVTPSTIDELISTINLAYVNDVKIRASGMMHTWCPLTVGNSDNYNKTILVKTANLNNMTIISNTSKHAIVKTQAGATMDQFLTFLETAGYGFINFPAPGDITIGGVLAIGGHGTAIPTTEKENLYTYGSVPNSIVALTAVVYNETFDNYTLKTFNRQDKDISGFLTNLGKTFIVDVTFQVLPNQNVRCQSFTNYTSAQLFPDPNKATEIDNTFSSLMFLTGIIEIILYPFTTNPWIKIWSYLPPNNSPQLKAILQSLVNTTRVSSPYNYIFSDVVPTNVSKLIQVVITNESQYTPQLGMSMLAITKAGLLATKTADIWGPSKNVFLYIKPTTLRYTANGFAILINRTNVQLALFQIMSQYNQSIESYKNESKYPINGPVEIRVTGLNSLVGLPDDSQQASIGTLLPPTFPNDYDCAIWFDILTYPGTPYCNEFYTEIQSFFMATFNGTGSLGLVRPEWSKGWAYTKTGAYTNTTILNENIPSLFPNWNSVVETFRIYDPKNLFSNTFLDTLIKNTTIQPTIQPNLTY